jgi:hypothetical protein
MSTITEIKRAVTTLSDTERYKLLCWMESEQAGYGDIPDEAFAENAAAVFDALDQEESERRGHGQSSSR